MFCRGASAAAAGVSLVQLHKEETAAPELARKKLPTMAVMSALVFAGQMINYTIPGTGSPPTARRGSCCATRRFWRRTDWNFRCVWRAFPNSESCNVRAHTV